MSKATGIPMLVLFMACAVAPAAAAVDALSDIESCIPAADEGEDKKGGEEEEPDCD